VRNKSANKRMVSYKKKEDMKLPTWFKIFWWIFITGSTAWLFYSRFPAIVEGKTALVDSFIFLVLVALLLVPIFQEISFFGLTFKQTIDDLKENISTQLDVFKADIQTTITNTSNVHVMFPYAPPPDDQLPYLEQRIMATVSEAIQEEGIASSHTAAPDNYKVDGDTEFLFRIRHTIEKKLRNIASYHPDLSRRHAVPIHQLSNMLVQKKFLNPKIAHALKEIYSVCSPAVHGEKVTLAQVNFVKDVAPQVVDALNEIELRTIGPA
jgi:hypothetical protein